MGHHLHLNTTETLDEDPKSSAKEERGPLSPNSNLHGLAVLVDKIPNIPIVASPGPHTELLSSSTSDVSARLFRPWKSSFLLSPSVREAKQEGVWDYPSSECSRWSNSHGSCCCPDGRGQREHGRRGPSEGSCSRPIYHGGFQRFVPVTFCWAQAEGCRGFGDCLFLS